MIQNILRTGAVAAALALAACGGSDDASTGAEDTAPGTAAALPQPDPNKPLSAYSEVSSGQDVMFLYAATSQTPPDFEDLAQTFSPEYRQTIDAFGKNDLMQTIKPQLEQGIAKAAAASYAWVDIGDARLESYDFERQGFTVGEFTQDIDRYFSDAGSYTYQWVNRDQVAFAPVDDEALARKLEAMQTTTDSLQRVQDIARQMEELARGGSLEMPPPQHPHLRVYFFAQSADLNNQRVNAVVTRVQITDHSGDVLFEYGPGESIPASSPETEHEYRDAAAEAASIFG